MTIYEVSPGASRDVRRRGLRLPAAAPSRSASRARGHPQRLRRERSCRSTRSGCRSFPGPPAGRRARRQRGESGVVGPEPGRPRPHALRRGLRGDRTARPSRSRLAPSHPAAARREAGMARPSQAPLAANPCRRRGRSPRCDPCGAAPVSRWDGQVVLVTGAQGFVGSWLAERLLDEGATVVVALRRDVDPESRFRTDGIEERCVIAQSPTCSITSRSLRVLNEHDVVGGVPPRRPDDRRHREPLAAVDLRDQRPRHLHCCSRPAARSGSWATRSRRVVVASSDKAYGRPRRAALPRGLRPPAALPVRRLEGLHRLIARSYAATYGLPVAVTRLANVYGGGDLNWSRIVPDTARSLAAAASAR